MPNRLPVRYSVPSTMGNLSFSAIRAGRDVTGTFKPKKSTKIPPSRTRVFWSIRIPMLLPSFTAFITALAAPLEKMISTPLTLRPVTSSLPR